MDPRGGTLSGSTLSEVQGSAGDVAGAAAAGGEVGAGEGGGVGLDYGVGAGGGGHLW